MKKISIKQFIHLSAATILAIFLASINGGNVIAEEKSQEITEIEIFEDSSAIEEIPAEKEAVDLGDSSEETDLDLQNTTESQVENESDFVVSQDEVPEDFATNEESEDSVDNLEVPNRRGFYLDENGNWHYADENGQDVTGIQVIDGATHHFDKNGIQTKGKEVVIDGKVYFFDKDSGHLWTNRFRDLGRTTYINGTFDENWTYYGTDGARVTGAQIIDGTEYYFSDRGIQYRYKTLGNGDGTTSYYGPSGAKVYNDWGVIRGMYLRGYSFSFTIYLDENGNMLKNGVKQIDGKLYYFDQSGYRIYGYYSSGSYYATSNAYSGGTSYPIIYEGNAYICSNSGQLISNTYFKNQYRTFGGNWYYLDAQGQVAKGAQIINDAEVYFDTESGVQVKGRTITGTKPTVGNYYYDADTGAKWTNRYLEYNDNWYYLDNDGNPLIGFQVVDGASVYFHEDGRQAKGELIKDENGYYHYYDSDTGEQVTNTSITININMDGEGNIPL